MREQPSLQCFNCLTLTVCIIIAMSSPGAALEKSASAADTLTPVTTIAKAFTDKQSNIQVKQKGVITRVLSDDTSGDRHQRMIVRLSNNQTLLITHNIDLAPRVPNPVVGKTLLFYGEYEWNDEGGVVHWTHKDPDGKHITGWLEYEGKRYSSIISSSVVSERHKIQNVSKQLIVDHKHPSDQPRFTLSGRFIPPGSIPLHDNNNTYYFILSVEHCIK